MDFFIVFLYIKKAETKRAFITERLYKLKYI